jgi:hypothetical protein
MARMERYARGALERVQMVVRGPLKSRTRHDGVHFVERRVASRHSLPARSRVLHPESPGSGAWVVLGDISLSRCITLRFASANHILHTKALKRVRGTTH